MTSMRVSEKSQQQVIQESIGRSRERMEKLQFQSATLKKLNTPSDDPVSTAKILELRTDQVNSHQYETNIKMAQSFLQNTDHVLSDLSEVVLRAKEIALQQSSTASSSEGSRVGVAEEIAQLYDHAIATANCRIGERYLLGGFCTQDPPVSPDGEYLGDEGEMSIEVANQVFVAMNIPGSAIFEVHQVNLFDELQHLRIALLTGDLEGVHGTLESLDQLRNHLVMRRAQVGSRLQGLESTNQAGGRHRVTQASLTSLLEDADMAKVMSDLNREEAVLRSSLSSAKRLIQPSLLDFLK